MFAVGMCSFTFLYCLGCANICEKLNKHRWPDDEDSFYYFVKIGPWMAMTGLIGLVLMMLVDLGGYR